MKTKVEWLGIVRQMTVMALVAVSLVGLTGCGDDDGDGGGPWNLAGTWDATFAGQPVDDDPLVLTEEFNNITNFSISFSENGETFFFEINGSKFKMSYTGPGEHFTLDGTIHSDSYITGTISGTDSEGNFSGPFTLTKR